MEDILQVTSEELGGIPVVHVSGEVDVSTAPVLHDALAAVPESSARVVVDLSAVTFLDSTGIGVLVAALMRLRDGPSAGTLGLVVTRPHLNKVLEVTGLTTIFDIHPSLEGALAR